MLPSGLGHGLGLVWLWQVRMDVQAGTLPWHRLRAYHGHSVSMYIFCVYVAVLSAQIACFHLSCTMTSVFFMACMRQQLPKWQQPQNPWCRALEQGAPPEIPPHAACQGEREQIFQFCLGSCSLAVTLAVPKNRICFSSQHHVNRRGPCAGGVTACQLLPRDPPSL